MHIGRGSVGPVEVAWAIESAAGNAVLPASIGASQVRRAAMLTGARAASFATGRRLLARLAGELAPGAALEIDSRCATCGEDHGRPRSTAAPLALSVAYAGPLVVAAAARLADVEAVGIDVERAGDAPRLTGLVSSEAGDLAGWTRIEAVLKADGRGIRLDPGDVRIDMDAPGRLLRQGSAGVPGRDDELEVATVTGPAGHLLSVAVITPRR